MLKFPFYQALPNQIQRQMRTVYPDLLCNEAAAMTSIKQVLSVNRKVGGPDKVISQTKPL